MNQDDFRKLVAEHQPKKDTKRKATFAPVPRNVRPAMPVISERKGVDTLEEARMIVKQLLGNNSKGSGSKAPEEACESPAKTRNVLAEQLALFLDEPDATKVNLKGSSILFDLDGLFPAPPRLTTTPESLAEEREAKLLNSIADDIELALRRKSDNESDGEPIKPKMNMDELLGTKHDTHAEKSNLSDKPAFPRDLQAMIADLADEKPKREVDSKKLKEMQASLSERMMKDVQDLEFEDATSFIPTEFNITAFSEGESEKEDEIQVEGAKSREMFASNEEYRAYLEARKYRMSESVDISSYKTSREPKKKRRKQDDFDKVSKLAKEKYGTDLNEK